MTTSFDCLSKTQKIRATLHRDVHSICTETCHFLGLEITRPAMDVIAELVYKKVAVYGTDLEAFAKHSKRATINSEDVKLLVRRNPSLKAHLNAIAPPSNSVAKDKRRKTVALPTAKSDTPAKTNEDIPRQMEETPAKSATKAAKKTDEFEDMIIDNTIDLTFD